MEDRQLHGHHHDHSNIDSIEKMTALLGHLYQHNADHTDDLHGVVDSLNKLGRNDVADKVKEAISEYDKANAVLHDALHLL